MRRACGAVLLAAWVGLAWGADASLQAKQAQQEQAKSQQAQLRARIETLRKEIDSQESSRRDAALALKASESAISAINRRLGELADEQSIATRTLRDLQAQISDQKQELTQRQKELGDQLRAQYASGLSPWTALLSGDDPQAIGRDLSYLGYISQAQADAVRAIRGTIDKLAALQAQSTKHQQKLTQLAQETSEQKKDLDQQKAERQHVLGRIEAQLAEQRGQAQRLERNDKRLADLIEGLDQAIAKQLEEERVAEAKRRAEQARLAEQARRAAIERRQAAEREREAAREAQLAARQAQERAQREQDARSAEQARMQVEQARAREQQAERAARSEEQRASAETQTPSPRHDGSIGMNGLPKTVPYPVRGEVQGRFGSERPEGGLWRGIVLRSPEGTPVKVIAAGRVVYASWLSGFGNIIIVDHGAKYLSVYAYNQSLLKRVGDMVAAGDAIATVGATGGQVEPGLYFEIRRQGAPVNPLLWLQR